MEVLTVDSKALHQITYGLYLVCSVKDGASNGQVANTAIQVSNNPVTIAVSINKENLTHEFIQSSGLVTVSVLEQETPLTLIGTFGFKSGRDTDKFAEVSHRQTQEGVPYVTEHVLSYLAGKVVGQMDAGHHTVFIFEVDEAEVLAQGTPMTYAYYHQVKRGTTPRTAPVAPQENKVTKERSDSMDKYVCTICGYVYDPEEGDPDSDAAPGTPFEKLPDDWICPICAAGKDAFEKE